MDSLDGNNDRYSGLATETRRALFLNSLPITYRGVPPESGLVSKCSPTRIAHERFLSRVDAMVALEGIYLGELLPTLVTTIRPLS